MGKKTVLLAQPLAPLAMDLLRQEVELQVASSPDPSVLVDEIKGKHGLIVRLSRATAEVIAAGDRLEVIGRTGVGVDNVDLDAATKHGVPVCYTPDANTISVAEHVLGVVLTLAKNFHTLDRATREGNWAARDRYGFELTGRTFGFIGLGKIGSLAARMCRGAFDAHVLAFDPYLAPSAAADLGVTLVGSLDELLQRSDVVSLHVPLTPETVGLIGARELAMMKPTAYLVNASRGSVVEEKALADALSRAVIAGAALDVYEKEPLPSDSPLLAVPNLLLTPHSAALTHEAMERVLRTMVADVLAVLRGETPRYVANREVLRPKR